MKPVMIGRVAGGGRSEKPMLKRNSWPPKIHGAAMNAVEHTHGAMEEVNINTLVTLVRLGVIAPPGQKVTNSRPDQVVVALHDLRVSPGCKLFLASLLPNESVSCRGRLRTEAFSLPDVVSSQFREELILSPGRGIRHFRTCYQQLASGHVICLFPEVKIYGRDCLSQRIMPLVEVKKELELMWHNLLSQLPSAWRAMIGQVAGGGRT
ncbi:predicted protein [Arabidopsis lyrata subsp. lyrata]|uniref:Predicted protein n=1 Tax=Arabidopsis lyrata subsp. lyrata TaxID=81972 RepID=D7MMI8_ARALL|nr:predicted protein [Arabidopsis lyrata subsp. lyrata]